jgi:hypothetical protein
VTYYVQLVVTILGMELKSSITSFVDKPDIVLSLTPGPLRMGFAITLNPILTQLTSVDIQYYLDGGPTNWTSQPVAQPYSGTVTGLQQSFYWFRASVKRSDFPSMRSIAYRVAPTG